MHSPVSPETPRIARLFLILWHVCRPLLCLLELIIFQVGAINQGKRCPSVSFFSTIGTSGDPSSSVNFETNICGYSPKDTHLMTREGAISNLGFAEIFFVVEKSHDPFCDSHPHTTSVYKSFFAFENREYRDWEDVDPGRGEKQVLDQCVGHAIEARSRQFRVFYFSVLVVGNRARLFRWDRAGAIVTEAFDLRNQPRFLCEFLWRFHLANPAQRGLDPTVVVASQAEEYLFKKSIRKHAAIQLGISEHDCEKLNKALSRHYEEGKVAKVEVYERGHPKPAFHLISVPLACPRSISGHSTRAYWSVKLAGENKGTVCFLKDTWRLGIDCMGSEGSIYEEMEDAKVENICDLECYGDVPVSHSADDLVGVCPNNSCASDLLIRYHRRV